MLFYEMCQSMYWLFLGLLFCDVLFVLCLFLVKWRWWRWWYVHMDI